MERQPIAFPIFDGLEGSKPQVVSTLKGKDHTRGGHLHSLGVTLWSTCQTIFIPLTSKSNSSHNLLL